jgi:hypothetical protein
MTGPNTDPPPPVLPVLPVLPEDFPFGSDKQPVGRTGRLSRFVQFVLLVLLLSLLLLLLSPWGRRIDRADDEAPPQRGMRRKDGSSASGRPERREARALQARTASIPAKAGSAMG